MKFSKLNEIKEAFIQEPFYETPINYGGSLYLGTKSSGYYFQCSFTNISDIINSNYLVIDYWYYLMDGDGGILLGGNSYTISIYSKTNQIIFYNITNNSFIYGNLPTDIINRWHYISIIFTNNKVIVNFNSTQIINSPYILQNNNITINNTIGYYYNFRITQGLPTNIKINNINTTTEPFIINIPTEPFIPESDTSSSITLVLLSALSASTMFDNNRSRHTSVTYPTIIYLNVSWNNLIPFTVPSITSTAVTTTPLTTTQLATIQLAITQLATIQLAITSIKQSTDSKYFAFDVNTNKITN